MNKYAKYTVNLRNIIMISIFINILSKHEISSEKFLILFGVFALILINDYLRYKYFYRGFNTYVISLFIGFLFSIWLMFTYSEFYYFAILFELTSSGIEGKTANTLIVSHVIIFFIQLIYSIDSTYTFFTGEFWKENGVDILFYVAFYLIMFFTCMYVKMQIREREKFRKLNNELNEAYEKLKEYSSKVEELTITKERNRVASEIHDSLGHSLTALIMHLDFLENITGKDSERAKVIISKCQSLARGSMEGLRKAVYAIKEEEQSKNLINSINELIDNFIVNEGIKINFNLEESLEGISPDIKNIVYRTVQEALTNGIKHGKATEFLIDIFDVEHGLEFRVNDNGIGCEEIVKGNGLCNIEKRIYSVGGKVRFSSNADKGFLMYAYIPLKEVETAV